MPELPEVETIKRGLEKKIVGLKIKDIQVLNPKTFQADYKQVIGKKVVKVWRRAKILGIDLTKRAGDSEEGSRRTPATTERSEEVRRDTEEAGPAVALLFHLKMSGQLVFVDQGKRFVGGHPTPDMKLEMPNKSTRVIFEFSDGGVLYFNDQRKFGWVKIVDRQQALGDSLLKNLGPEPLEKDFSWEVLKERVGKHKNWAIKVAIMDQQSIAGVGNIYASEACFNAKLDPRRKVSSLSDKEWQSLHKGLIKALEDGIKHGGSSRVHFVNTDGEPGFFLDYANVYRRDGQKCKVCGTTIEKTQLAGRGTFFCPKCQK